jgi:NADH-quinone oxidoreductase subunit L
MAVLLDWLWIAPALPLAGFVILALVGRRLPKWAVGTIGAGSVGLSAAFCAFVAWAFVTNLPPAGSFTLHLWTWIDLVGFTPQISLYLDRLSMVMMLVVTGVAFMIHLYSTEYMLADEGYSRFFAYLNLFVAFMLVLVLAGDLLLLLLGWEGVGLCSYLLIGFWYRDPENGRAAQKSFIVTRIGDAAFLLGLLLFFTELGSENIQEILQRAAATWPPGSLFPTLAAFLILGGAIGKSAQLPLQVWLPDAMAGPTPVSALIHAATMVTAGVYLIGRTESLFAMAPLAQALVGVIGAATILISGFAALGQRDIKRILAYSTISQIGYMVLALGAGSLAAAIFHLMSHAFFKALLFLAAGAIIHSYGGERDIFKMGGLRSRRPFAFWTFLIGASSLAAVPLVTSGYYSKGQVLEAAWAYPHTIGIWLWVAGVIGAFVTALYIFRAVFVASFGEPRTKLIGGYGILMGIPMVILALLSLGGGGIQIPGFLGPLNLPGHPVASMHLIPEVVAESMTVIGIVLAYFLFYRPKNLRARSRTFSIFRGGLGFDFVYDSILVRPFVWMARAARGDLIDGLYRGIAALVSLGYRFLSYTQSGMLRWYVAGTVIGAVVLVGVALLTSEVIS